MTFSSNLQRKSAAVLTELAICAVLKLNCGTYSHAFHRDGGMAFVWKNRVTDLLCVNTIVGFDVSHSMCANSRKTM